MPINWDDMRYFLAVAETGSLSAASRRLHVAQPTVGRRIQALESGLKARLFEHFSHGYTLTAIGEQLLEHAQTMEQAALRIERRAAGIEQQIAGPVGVATTEGLGYWLTAKLPLLRERYPQLELELMIDMSLIDMLRRQADVALRVGGPGSDALVGRCVGQVGFGLFAAPDYLAQVGEPRSMEELAEHTLIESTGAIAALAQVKQLREAAREATISLKCNHITVQMGAARAGLGLLALPVYYRLIGADELRQVLKDIFTPKLDLWLVSHPDLRASARVRAVLTFIAEQVQADQALLLG